MPLLPEPFDVAAQRRVGLDSTVRFDGRSYSVPFAFAHPCVHRSEAAGIDIVLRLRPSRGNEALIRKHRKSVPIGALPYREPAQRDASQGSTWIDTCPVS